MIRYRFLLFVSDDNDFCKDQQSYVDSHIYCNNSAFNVEDHIGFFFGFFSKLHNFSWCPSGFCYRLSFIKSTDCLLLIVSIRTHWHILAPLAVSNVRMLLDAALVRLYWAVTIWGNEMNFVMKHAPGARSIALPIDQQSNALSLYHGHPLTCTFKTNLLGINIYKG